MELLCVLCYIRILRVMSLIIIIMTPQLKGVMSRPVSKQKFYNATLK